MKQFSCLVLAVVAALLPSNAHADWMILGAATRCDPQSMTFTVVPTVETSDSASNYDAPKYFTALPNDPDQTYSCAFSDVNVELNIRVYPPQSRGMGQGGGVVIISSLKVNAATLLSETNFNWQVVPDERVLTKIIVAKRGDALTTTLCYSDGWEWERPYEHLSCEISRVGS